MDVSATATVAYKTTYKFTGQSVAVTTTKPFLDVCSALDIALNRRRSWQSDLPKCRSSAELDSLLIEAVGSSGFLFFEEQRSTTFENAGSSNPRKSVTYSVASRSTAKALMRREPTLAPFKVSVIEGMYGQKGAVLQYNLISSQLAIEGQQQQLQGGGGGAQEVMKLAIEMDKRMANLVRTVSS